jgi:iron complex outermembrane receptor protein
MKLTSALLAGSISLLAMSSAALAQQNQSVPAEVPETVDSGAGPVAGTEEQIVVTGTRRINRTVADSPVPVDVISGTAITQNGFTETNRVLNQLVPSFNFPQPSITDGTDTVRPATLRGLSPDQTLVLINGKRRHTTALLNINGSVGRGSSAVDINLIPTIAIGRVEVLRDGAAAQYGSDAIAGVINFQLANAREGGRFTVTYGQYDTRVEGIESITGLLLGAGGQPVLGADANRNGNGDIFETQRTGKDRHVTDGQTVTVAGTVGLPLGPDGYLNISAEYQDRNPHQSHWL